MHPKASNAPARPHHGRQPSTSKPDKSKQLTREERDSAAMPPPPKPPKQQPEAILGPELDMLEDTMKTISVKTAQIFRYYANVKKLGVERHVPRSPQSLTSALATELGRYDQICDALDAQLARAIAVLQRDLTKEEKRIQEEELEKARADAAAAAATLQSGTDADIVPTAEAPSESETRTRQTTPTGKPPVRRPSKISLSALRGAPLKLDLSSTALRLDDPSLNMSSFGLGGMSALGTMGVSGLASPVTLAPKSARPMGPGEIPPEILAALATATADPSDQDPLMQSQDDRRIEIDLTLDDELHNSVDMSILGTSAGASADQAIDVDMDMNTVNQLTSDLFGDQEAGGQPSQENLFSPTEGNGTNLPSVGNMQTGDIDMNILNALSNDHTQTDALLASLDNPSALAGSSNLRHTEAVAEFGPGNSTSGPPFDYQGMEDLLNGSNIDVTQILGFSESNSGKASGVDSTGETGSTVKT